MWKSAQTWTGLAAKPEALGSPPGGRAREQVAVYSLPAAKGKGWDWDPRFARLHPVLDVFPPLPPDHVALTPDHI